MYQDTFYHADLGNGFYQNPILNGDYADPAVFRDGEDFYLCVSTANYLPGMTIFHSKDLVNWEVLCNPLQDPSLEAWAPDILKYEDKYYIYFSANGSNYVMWSDEISHGWSEPIDLKVGEIDPGHVVDEQGNRFLFLSENHMVALSKDGLSVQGEMKQVLQAPSIPKDWEIEGEFPEAPNLFKKDGYYYLTYADGGTSGPATSHMIMSARAKQLDGPWEMSPYNPIVHTWNRDEKWVSKGHGHFVEDTQGQWWVIYHAYENGYESQGRKLLLSPVEFTEDGWFQVTVSADEICRKPAGIALERNMQLSDDFSGEKLKNYWKAWGETEWERYVQKNHILTVQALDTSIGKSRPLTLNTGDHNYEISVKILKKAVGIKAGLLLQYDETIFNGISFEDDQLVVYRIGRPMWRERVNAETIELKMVYHEQYVSFYYRVDGADYKKLSPTVNVSSQNTNAYGKFLSLRPGIFACGMGEVQFGEFIYKGNE